jgi:type I restriction-modification system DNA methylase subunit
MDNRALLEKLSQSFHRNDLTQFMRAASGKFRPERADYSHLLMNASSIRGLQQLGRIDFDDGRRLTVVAGEMDQELTSHSGKKKQYEIAQKVLGNDFDAGIFVFHDDAGHFRFSLIAFGYKDGKKMPTSFRRYTYFVSPDLSARTFVEQIGKADFSSIEKITEAFSVEPVTKEFFQEFRRIFEEAEDTIKLRWDVEKKRLYTQRFFNRMLFIAFLERKGWLIFNGRKDYLRALFADYYENEENKRNASFHKSRLNTLFFRGLNNPHGDQLSRDPRYKIFQRLIGDVPYLNGGLFEEEPEDIDGPLFPDGIVGKVLSDLIYHFNFTVTESTPLDVEVAVDPEMLGRIFEELVTGRHESGSYYTPKPVVAFMCREALKGYLETALPDQPKEVLALFVNENDAGEINNPEAVLNALRAVKVCDPACGSGAYLLGMLHELLDKRESLFTARRVDARTIYDRKLEIIQNNLYGVDIDPFAVNIARLRLWLSLIVDYEGDNPPPLPNLEFKIETGDSLTAPDPSGGLQPDMFRYGQVQEFLRLKNEFMGIHAGSEKKKKLAEEIKELKEKIREWAYPKGKGHANSANAFDWQVDFAEVFAPELAQSTLGGRMAGIVNTAGGQMELTAVPREGGFDIVLANPPYVRMELFKDIKPVLKRIYSNVHDERADLYIYFYARTQQILRPGGLGCFISSNKWLRARYGEKLRQLLLDRQAFRTVVDFGELPVFQTAATFPAIFLWQKRERGNSSTQWAVIKDLHACYEEGIREHVARIAHILPYDQFGTGKSRIASTSDAERRRQMEKHGTPLGNLQAIEILYGIKTGLNDAFIISEDTKKTIVRGNPKASEVIKPLLAGDDIRKYEIHKRNNYLIYTYHGVDMRRYPEILKCLRPYKNDLRKRATQQEWYELQQPQYNYSIHFNHPKIVYPDIGKETRFVMDLDGYYVLNTAYALRTSDYYILGVLNSSFCWNYVKNISAVLGNENEGGRVRFIYQYLEKLPIPDAEPRERDEVRRLAKQAQNLHMQRRKHVEKFLRDIGIEPAESTSRNPLESPWLLSEEDFTRRARGQSVRIYKSAREETMSLTEEIVEVEKEIDERVKALYGL